MKNKIRDEQKVLNMCEKIGRNWLLAKNDEDIDYEYFLEKIEDNTDETTQNYTQEDYKIMLFNSLELLLQFTKEYKAMMNGRDKLIRFFYKNLKRLSEFEVDLSKVYDDGEGDIDIFSTVHDMFGDN